MRIHRQAESFPRIATDDPYPEHHPADGNNQGTWKHVGWVQTDKILPYADHLGDQHYNSPKIVQHLTDEFKSGHGFINPLHLHYGYKNNEAFLGEGNHRLQAAIKAGVSHVPVVVHPLSKWTEAERAQPAQFPNKVGPQSYIPDSNHPANVLPHEWLHQGDLKSNPPEQWPDPYYPHGRP